jgi:hypothetical protein
MKNAPVEPRGSGRMLNAISRFRVALPAALLLSGCTSWTPGWVDAAPATARPLHSEALLLVDAQLENADTAEKLREVIAAYDDILKHDPSNTLALTQLAEAHILYGAAYARDRSEKAAAYRSGIRLAERAMTANPEFRARVAAGASVGEAGETLGESDVRPMLFWVTGVSYYFKETLSGLARLTHARWMLQTREVMERLMAIAPEYEGGTVPFSLAIYHIGSPPGAGRDLKKASRLLEQSIAVSPGSLLPRWGRAKYLHVRNGDREAFRRDLEWVLAQDPRSPGSNYRWNVYFQRDAKAMLDDIERNF